MKELRTPYLAADIIIELVDRPGCPIILIERRNPPYGWVIPGGFVDLGESLEQAAIREAAEETCTQVTLKTLLGIYSEPGRDPRFHTATAVFIAEACGNPKAADDAKCVRVVAIDDIPKNLAFDHDTIVSDYLTFRSQGRVAPLRGVK